MMLLPGHHEKLVIVELAPPWQVKRVNRVGREMKKYQKQEKEL